RLAGARGRVRFEGRDRARDCACDRVDPVAVDRAKRAARHLRRRGLSLRRGRRCRRRIRAHAVGGIVSPEGLILSNGLAFQAAIAPFFPDQGNSTAAYRPTPVTVGKPRPTYPYWWLCAQAAPVSARYSPFARSLQAAYRPECAPNRFRYAQTSMGSRWFAA